MKTWRGHDLLDQASLHLRRLFASTPPDAPGMVFVGGHANPAVLGEAGDGGGVASIGGSGLTQRDAFASCVGEGIEYLSQFAQPGDVTSLTPSDRVCSGNPQVAAFVAAHLVEPRQPIDWVATRNLIDGGEAFIPADFCLRRASTRIKVTAPFKLSTGCAAGTTASEATLRALLELIERDAAALWWWGGQRGREIDPESEAGRCFGAVLSEMRQGRTGRRTWALDITSDLAVPAVAAISARESDHLGMAIGLAARTTLSAATRAALFEMGRSEFAHHLAAAKQRAEKPLSEGDKRRFCHARVDTRACILLHPRPQPAHQPLDFPAAPDAALAHLLAMLRALAIPALATDLTRAFFGIPVVRVLAPGLQLEPSAIQTGRLKGAIATTGGGALHHGGIPLV